jgi:hypothetical protein
MRVPFNAADIVSAEYSPDCRRKGEKSVGGSILKGSSGVNHNPHVTVTRGLKIHRYAK